MADALARFKPSIVISTVAPRCTPCGDSALMVGGVIRVPVGESLVAAKIEVAMPTKVKIDFMSASIFFLLPDGFGLDGFLFLTHQFVDLAGQKLDVGTDLADILTDTGNLDQADNQAGDD